MSIYISTCGFQKRAKPNPHSKHEVALKWQCLICEQQKTKNKYDVLQQTTVIELQALEVWHFAG